MTVTPEHHKHIPPEHQAIAPYNFVPLPDKVIRAEPESLAFPDDRYARINEPGPNQRYSGQIACTLTTESPLYVRCGYTPEAYAVLAQKLFSDLSPADQERRAQFFNFGNSKQPVIPGSSLRGMLRTLVEIVSYSKVERVSEKQLFYRSVRDRTYQQEFVEPCGRVQHPPHPSANCFRTRVRAGFLRCQSGRYWIDACTFARIDTAPNRRGIAQIPLIGNEPVFLGRGPGRIPNWQYQNQAIDVVIDNAEQDYFFERNRRHPDLYLRFRAVQQASFTLATLPGARRGRLIITGAMQNKHMEFVFLEDCLERYDLDPAMVQRFQDDDQITPWQEQAFPKDKPLPGSRPEDGYLRNGEPVFFLLDADDQTVRFFGRAQLFRLPYGFAPADYVNHPVPKSDGAQPVDIADVLFGYVRGEKVQQDQVRAGRVFVGDAQLVSAPDGTWLDLEDGAQSLTPRILASPKPTTHQHYLVQTQLEEQRLHNYSSPPGETTLRGHKLYWHQDAVAEQDIRELDAQRIQAAPKQYTRIRPVKAGVTFEFDIHFENLSKVELGALLWVLRLADDERYRLKLGMGKPLGMGSIKIKPTLRVYNRVSRYSKLFDQQTWATGAPQAASDDVSAYLDAFECYVLDNLFPDTRKRQQHGTIERLPRIQCLLAMLIWPGPARDQARYMEIERDASEPENVIPAAHSRIRRAPNGQMIANEYSTRPILPGPVQIMGAATEFQFLDRVLTPERAIQASSASTGSTFSHVAGNQVIQRIQDLPTSRVATEIYQFYKQWRDLATDDPARVPVAEAIIARVRGANREKKSANKGWYQELLACVEGTEGKES